MGCHRTVLATSKPNMGWGIARCSGHEEKHKGSENATFSLSLSSSLRRMLTDDIRFRHRIDSRSQMSRSGNYRAVPGTSWRSWRDRLSGLLPSWTLSGSLKARTGKRGDGGIRRGRKRDERGEVEKKINASFHLPPRSSILSTTATSTTTCAWGAHRTSDRGGGHNLGLWISSERPQLVRLFPLCLIKHARLCLMTISEVLVITKWWNVHPSQTKTLPYESSRPRTTPTQLRAFTGNSLPNVVSAVVSAL